MTTEKVVNFFFGGGEEKCTPRENPGYEYEERAPPYVGMPSEWLIQPGEQVRLEHSQQRLSSSTTY